MPTFSSSFPGDRLAHVLLSILLVAVGLSGVFDRDLWTPDEPRVAAISLETSRTGDFVTPRLAGEPFVEQPPLYYATAALAAKMFRFIAGNTGAIRLTSVLWGLGTLAAVFLLSRRLYPGRPAFPVTLVLGTMLGFVENTHWIRVDAALLFFVTAAVWCCAETLLGHRRWFAVPAGVFAAGAFLTKGVMGPGIIALGWLALFAARVPNLPREEPGLCGQSERGNAGKRVPVWNAAITGIEPLILPHLLCVLVFVGIAGAWILLFRSRAGPELWREWFWTNQVARALGKTPQLGHLKPNPFYYIRTVLVYSLPWTPLIGVWAWRLARDLRVRGTIEPVNLFLLAWSAATIVGLSVSMTKRDLYLLPILPAFALLCADVLNSTIPRWCRVFFAAWGVLCAAILAVSACSPLVAYSPLLSGHLNRAVFADTASFLATCTPRHALAGVCFAVSLFLLLRPRAPRLVRTAAITAMLFIGLFAVAGKAIDLEKRLGPGIRSFAARIPKPCRDRVAGWGFSETMRGGFYCYCDWPVTRLRDLQRLRDVLSGKDGEFDSVIISAESGAPDLAGIPVETLADASVGPRGRERRLTWLRSARPDGSAEELPAPRPSH